LKNLVKRNVMWSAGTEAFSKFVSLLEWTDGRNRGLLLVLTYYRVDNSTANPALDPSLISATAEMFERQMAHLAVNCNVISMNELLN